MLPPMMGGSQHPQAPSPPSAPSGPARVRGGRLEFLDALRGIAAMSVAVQHGAELVWPSYLRWSVEVFRPGECGVLVFFLCSGFIIPASLERYDDLRRFWISRAFRLYPLYWMVIGGILVLHLARDLYPVPSALGAGGLLVNLTMVQYFASVPLIIGASWTLAYEMCFYLGCSILFLAGVHRRSSPIALTLVGVTLVGATVLPWLAVNGHVPSRRAIVLAGLLAAAVIAGLAWCTRDRGWPTRIAIAGLCAVTISLVINRPESFWFAMLLFATMFTGTVLYRWHSGHVPGWIAGAVVLLAAMTGAVGSYLNVDDTIATQLASAHHTWRPEALTYVIALAAFCGALALRTRAFPRPLIYLGTISYSVYLVHAVVIHVVPHVNSPVLTVITWIAVVVLVSSVTYHLVEKPAQDLGHRLARRIAPRGPAHTARDRSPVAGPAAAAPDAVGD
jgi:peptidoglycan/LPS O-acetylase OafA/YrhL